MRKILWLLSLLIVAIVLASCSHTHRAANTYLSDENYHWNSCTNVNCQEMLNKTEHTWGAGEVTSKPTSAQDGVMSYLCTVCKKLKQEPIKYVPSNTMTKEQWEKAFLQQSFENVTVKLTEAVLDIDYKTNVDISVGNNALYLEAVTIQSLQEIGYTAKYQTGGVELSISSKEQSWDDAKYELILNNGITITGILEKSGLLLSDYFSNFVYDESTSSYKAQNLVIEGVSFQLTDVTVKFADGKVIEIEATSTDGMYTKVSFGSYGETTPKDPLSKAE